MQVRKKLEYNVQSNTTNLTKLNYNTSIYGTYTKYLQY